MTQAITSNVQVTVGTSVLLTSQTRQNQYQVVAPPAHTDPTTFRQIHFSTTAQRLSLPMEWDEVEYRQAYLEESIEQGVAWQIRANRQCRGMSQRQLADAIGTQQSAVSRLEDPMSGLPNIETLIKIAHALDCALSVRFISYRQLAIESEDLSPEALYAAPYGPHSKLIKE
ncbi:multiprotein-bridging factor 1 family protein [Cupriavidus sp. 2KB_3]|uniref:helix-turn-helix domain-containing protein n=1 Tax=Cupriavidus sp. 2KB_3 TaxID=3232980 RepID=UPI003F927A12